jgi:hypothetical protein
MNRNSALLAVCFCAGLLGALVNSLVAWLAGRWGLTAIVGVSLAPALSTGWLYPRLVWGGVWGLLLYPFVARPRNRCHWVRKGLWLSLLPTAFQLFYFFPHHTSYELFGFGLGTFTPAVVLLFNFVWGFCTGLFTRLFWGRG